MTPEHATLEAIHGTGRRMTRQRQQVLAAIQEIGGHVSVERIHQRLRDDVTAVDVATVYRTVSLLARLHALNEVSRGGVATYEIVDPEHPHHHMVCEHCGITLHLDPAYLDGLREQLVRETGFEPHMEHFTISGLCAACRANQPHAHNGHTHAGSGHTHGHSEAS